MNVIKKAGCIGALVAGLCAAEPNAHADYSSPPRTYAAEIGRTHQVEKDEATKANDEAKMAFLGFAGVAALVGMGLMICYAYRDQGDYR